MKKPLNILLVAVMTAFLLSPFVRAGSMELLGAGATFPLPLYTKMFDTYNQKYGVKVNYQGVGSGAGITQLINKTVDFGATDAFMSDEELLKAGAPVLHVPICLGAVVLTYNLPGNPEVKFTPDLVADIYLGKVTKWNDPGLTTINPGMNLPDMNITVVHRSDGSGTTYIFSDYLSKVSGEWKAKPGTGKSLNWLVGLGAKGNPGVAGMVKQLPGSIGYVELIYAMQNKMPVGIIKNRSGNFVEPSIKSASLAAGVKLPDDARVSITNTDAKDGYPISGFTWVILYKEQNYGGRSKDKAEALLKLLWWMTHEGQALAEPLQYSPLPKDAVAKAEAILRSAVYSGSRILKSSL